MSNPATKTNEQLAQESIHIAQNILSRRFNGSLQLEAGAVLRGSNRSYVARCHVSGGTGSTPETVVVKRALSSESEQYDPNSSSGPTMGLFNEWASLQFLGECFGEASLVPRFLGGDREAGVVVMQDVGAAPGLDVLLRGDDAAAASDALGGLFHVLGDYMPLRLAKASAFKKFGKRWARPNPETWTTSPPSPTASRPH